MDFIHAEFGEVMGAMLETLAQDMEAGVLVEAPMAEYTFKFTEIDTGATLVFTVDHRWDVPMEELYEFAAQELILDLSACDITVDKSDTLDSDGNVKYPDSLKVLFRVEEDAKLMFDGIPDEGAEDEGEDFVGRIMPIISTQINLGTFELLEKVQYED
jgi:hypothetical protein